MRVNDIACIGASMSLDSAAKWNRAQKFPAVEAVASRTAFPRNE